MNVPPSKIRPTATEAAALSWLLLSSAIASARPVLPKGLQRRPAPHPKARSVPSSVRVHKGPIRVWSRPAFGSPLRGEIVKAGRFPVAAVLPPGGGCGHRWYKLGPNEFVCSGWLIPSAHPPTRLTDVTTSTRHGPWVVNRNRRTDHYPTLGHFARNRPDRLRGLAGFQVLGRRLVGSIGFLRVRHNGWIRETAVKAAPRSVLVGVTVTKPKDLPLAFVLRDRTPVFKQVGQRLEPTGTTLDRHAVRKAWQTGSFFSQCYRRVGTRYWVRCENLAVADRPPVPPKQVSAKENWLDLDSDSRILYGRQGGRVVRVMLVSLSDKTPHGLFRIREKMVNMDLVQRWGDDPYYLQGVPHVLFFHKNIALHAAYWHNGFGVHRSHGCVNLSIPDARWVFDFVRPLLPAGYRHIVATGADPGTYLRVRRKGLTQKPIRTIQGASTSR